MAKTPSSDGASRGCGMRARRLATAQNPTLAAEGRTAKRGDGVWHFGAAPMCAGCLEDRRPD